MNKNFEKIIALIQAGGACLWIVFSVFNAVRSLLDGYVFLTFMFVLLAILMYRFLIHSINEYKNLQSW